MGQQLTFKETFETWMTLVDPSIPEGAWDASLLQACESIILHHPVTTHAEAASVCAVLSHGTWGVEAAALDALAHWLRREGASSVAVTDADRETTL